MHCVNYWCLNVNRCGSEQQVLKTIEKRSFETERTWKFWETNSLLIWWEGEHSHKYSSVKMNLESPHIFMMKCGFKMVKFTFCAGLVQSIATWTIVESPSGFSLLFNHDFAYYTRFRSRSGPIINKRTNGFLCSLSNYILVKIHVLWIPLLTTPELATACKRQVNFLKIKLTMTQDLVYSVQLINAWNY